MSVNRYISTLRKYSKKKDPYTSELPNNQKLRESYEETEDILELWNIIAESPFRKYREFSAKEFKHELTPFGDKFRNNSTVAENVIKACLIHGMHLKKENIKYFNSAYEREDYILFLNENNYVETDDSKIIEIIKVLDKSNISEFASTLSDDQIKKLLKLCLSIGYRL